MQFLENIKAEAEKIGQRMFTGWHVLNLFPWMHLTSKIEVKETMKLTATEKTESYDWFNNKNDL